MGRDSIISLTKTLIMTIVKIIPKPLRVRVIGDICKELIISYPWEDPEVVVGKFLTSFATESN